MIDDPSDLSASAKSLILIFCRHSKMPCCCASNIKAAKILGIILAFLYALGIVYDFTEPLTKENIFTILTGFLGLATASILAYGAFTRNSKAMLIYIYSTIVVIILFIAGAIWGVVVVFNVVNSDEIANAKEELIEEACNQYRGTSNYQVCLDTVNDQFDQLLKTAGPIGLIIVVVIAVASIVFDIWTIFVAKNAKKEIEDESTLGVRSWADFNHGLVVLP